ncbi:MAG TPA: RES family NAD+ phosphorylase [Bryobacteraceae bacterium]|nr:RES family NAD+ phosphorylase [Bryobacteraceae bacterium]
MPALWRLYRAQHGPGLDGIGGTFANGRWHTLGERVVYFGASAAIVVLERLAHTDPDLLPDDLRLALFEFTEPVQETKVDEFATLPANWNKDENATRRIGGRWRQRRSSCLLVVPSAILPEESNFVLNPEHPGAQGLRLVRERQFTFDPRLI